MKINVLFVILYLRAKQDSNTNKVIYFVIFIYFQQALLQIFLKTGEDISAPLKMEYFWFPTIILISGICLGKALVLVDQFASCL